MTAITQQQTTVDSLKEQIEGAISSIKDKSKSPKEAGVGKLFNQLRDIDENAYKSLMADYKPVSDAYFEKQRELEAQYWSSPEGKKARAKMIDDAVRRAGSGGGGISDSELMSGPQNRNAKELKIKKPKEKVAKLPKEAKEKGNRDRRGYKFKGEEYGKGQLVLAIIRDYVVTNPKATLAQIKTAWPESLLKGYGIVQEHARALEISKNHKRFFLKDDQLIKIGGGVIIAVCNQFSSENIHPFLDQAKKLGYQIEQ